MRKSITGVILVLALCLVGGCTTGADEGGRPETAQPAFRNANTEVDFVGSAACFDCHEEQYRGYQEHGMAHSFASMTPERAGAGFQDTTLYHRPSDLYYRVYEREGRYVQEEYRLDADGDTTHRLVRMMEAVVGSGSAAHTYLTKNKGHYYELPLTRYTQVGKWDFSPGFKANNLRFERLVPDRCMACHNSYPESVSFVEGKYETVPQGIGCERCHGPGALHVEARLARPEPAGEVDSTIVNPAHLSLERRMDVCQQCHLHTTVSVLREGRGPFDYRPSEPLAAHVSLFAEAQEENDDQIAVISHADRLKESPCFIATKAREGPAMDCMTCHDPHEGFRDAAPWDTVEVDHATGPDYFNATCKDCHQPGRLQEAVPAEVRSDHQPSANCVSCHMPKVEAEDAPHASFTDHKIRVVDDVPETKPLPRQEAEQLEAYFERDREGTDARRYRGIAYVTYGRQQGDQEAFKKGIRLLEEVLADDPEHGRAQFLLGYARMQLGQHEEALPALEASVRQDPSIPERLNALAQAYEATGRDPANIRRLYERALSIQPALAEVRVNYGRFLETQRQLGEAMQQYRLAARERPWLATAYYNLGTAFLRQGETEQGERRLQRAVTLRPDYARALSNLGLLYAQRGRTERAGTYFERAVKSAPDDAVSLGNLGTFYLNEGRRQEAIDLLGKAVDIDPAYVDGLVNLALAYYRDEQYRQAGRFARRALQLDPNNSGARQIVGAVNRR